MTHRRWRWPVLGFLVAAVMALACSGPCPTMAEYAYLQNLQSGLDSMSVHMNLRTLMLSQTLEEPYRLDNPNWVREFERTTESINSRAQWVLNLAAPSSTSSVSVHAESWAKNTLVANERLLYWVNNPRSSALEESNVLGKAAVRDLQMIAKATTNFCDS